MSDRAGFAFTPDPEGGLLPGFAPQAPPESPRPKPPAAAPALVALKPHYHGHRDRLRARFAEAGAEALADYELLELVLFRLVPRQDTKPLAKLLIAEFGDLSAALGAPVERLRRIPGVGDAVAADLKAMAALFDRARLVEAKRRPVISAWSHLLNYCQEKLQHEPREHFRVLYLDRKNQLISDVEMARGTVDQAAVYPREVVARALELGASSLILVHNHPSGDPSPSKADIEITRAVVMAAKTLSVDVHDHLIVGRYAVASLKSLGLM